MPTNPSSGPISLSQINNVGAATNSMGSLVNEIIGGNFAANETISMSDFYFTQSYTQQATLIGTPNGVASQGQGWTTAISADGNTLITSELDRGRIYIFTRSGTSWTQQTSFQPTGTNSSYVGYSLSLSADGNTAVIGSPYASSNAGTAYVYTRSGTTWTLQQQLSYTGGAGTPYFGWSTALSANGNILAIGGYQDGTGGTIEAGKVWIFTRSGTTWTQQTTFTPNVASENFGSSVAFSADGATLAVGTDASPSFLYVYTGSGSSWTQAAKVSTPAFCAGSVTISADGKTILCSAGNSSGGAIISVIGYNGSTWVTLSTINRSTNPDNADFGNVCLSADSNLLCTGTQFGVNSKAYIYIRSGSNYSYNRRLTLASYPNSYFGSSAAMGANGNTLAIGAQQYPAGGTGAVIIYT
jgi:hypothetical protein